MTPEEVAGTLQNSNNAITGVSKRLVIVIDSRSAEDDTV